MKIRNALNEFTCVMSGLFIEALCLFGFYFLLSFAFYFFFCFCCFYSAVFLLLLLFACSLLLFFCFLLFYFYFWEGDFWFFCAFSAWKRTKYTQVVISLETLFRDQHEHIQNFPFLFQLLGPDFGKTNCSPCTFYPGHLSE